MRLDALHNSRIIRESAERILSEDLKDLLRIESASTVLFDSSKRALLLRDTLLNCNGNKLRRALFSLKQVFQDDKDLVHEFVQNEGLGCLLKLGREADSNHQNYILRALGQVMLYVDGMNGIIGHNETIQWLYELLESQYRLVVKTALKLLVVFIEYTESNSLQLMAAVMSVDRQNGRQDWSSLMKILNEKDPSDQELLVYAMTVINKTLNGVPDQDTYYDIVDSLDSQGLEDAMRQMIALNNRELREQCRIYEKVLNHEDAGDEDSDAADSPTAKMRTPLSSNGRNQNDRRNVMRRRHQEALARQEPHHQFQPSTLNETPKQPSWRQSQPSNTATNGNGASTTNGNGAVESNNNNNPKIGYGRPPSFDGGDKPSRESFGARRSNKPPSIDIPEEEPIQNRSAASNNQPDEATKPMIAPPPAFPNLFSPTDTKPPPNELTYDEPSVTSSPAPPPPVAEVKQTPAAQPTPAEDSDDGNAGGGSNFAALLKKRVAKKDKSYAQGVFKSAESESEAAWKRATENMANRPLIINDLDFTEFAGTEDDQDPLIHVRAAEMMVQRGLLPGAGSAAGGRVPPPPPPMFGGAPPPPPLPGMANGGRGARDQSPGAASVMSLNASRTLKLHWKEAQTEAPPVPNLKSKGIFWNKVVLPDIDAEKLGQLFETKTKDVVKGSDRNKREGETKKPEVLAVLSVKRSQAINIGLTKLPPPRAIKAAILKMDATVLNKEGIDKILQTMMPSPTEVEAIQNAQAENPDMPLGSAEQFIMLLSEVPNLLERLKLWIFMLDYASIEKDIAEPLMDLKLSMEEIENSSTFANVMATVLAVGNHLNGADIKGFQLDYLSKIAEVKDTVHKHSLVYHICGMVMDRHPDSTDLYSEFGAVSRCSKVDFDEVDETLKSLEKDCRACWDYLARLCSKSENEKMKEKIDEFLTNCAGRIAQLKSLNTKIKNRFRRFLLYMGTPPADVPNKKVNTMLKTIIEFALEYRTSRDKIVQQKKRLADKRERNKTRGKIWAPNAQSGEEPTDGIRKRGGPHHIPMNSQERHDEMTRLLTGGADDGGPRRRIVRPSSERTAASMIAAQREGLRPATTSAAEGQNPGESPDDEILDGLVKAATIQTEPRETRRKARQFNRKSLRRTRTLKLVEDQIGSSINY
uniref:Uncharacterized protein n=1 Tax=Plectus sambesii TaxID=2011161 RepID=A0A914WS14_9BILA